MPMLNKVVIAQDNQTIKLIKPALNINTCQDIEVISCFYVTDGNIMYLTDASRFLISCVIQHYAPVVGGGGVEEQMHNVDYVPGS